jgi:hypothetical protein
MRDDHSGIPGGPTAPKAEEQQASEPHPGPRPAPAHEGPGGEVPRRHPDPTRYGDWVKDGRCIDF